MSTDSTIMLRRNFKHTLRDPTAVFNAVLMPVVIMFMFVYMLGDAFNVGVDYVDCLRKWPRGRATFRAKPGLRS